MHALNEWSGLPGCVCLMSDVFGQPLMVTDRRKKSHSGKKKEKEIKGEEVEDRREQGDADMLTLRLSDGVMCVGVKHVQIHTCMQEVSKYSLQKCQMSD